MQMALSESPNRAWQIYQRLLADISPNENGKAIAIHAASGDSLVGATHSEARRLLSERHPEGEIVTFTIGPSTPADTAVGYRILAGQKRCLSESTATMPHESHLRLLAEWVRVRSPSFWIPALKGRLYCLHSLLRAIGAELSGSQVRLLADGSAVECEVCYVVVDWDGKLRRVSALALEGNPLLGVEIFENYHLDIEAAEGGEVLIERI